MPPEPEPCVKYVNGVQAIISSDDVQDKKIVAEKEGMPLDCMWNITVTEGWKVISSISSIYVNAISLISFHEFPSVDNISIIL